MGCIQALLERPVTIGVKGSHCGGGFFAVKDGGSSGSCIAIIDALCNAVQVVENEPNFEAVKGREGKKTIEESSWPFGEFWPLVVVPLLTQKSRQRLQFFSCP